MICTFHQTHTCKTKKFISDGIVKYMKAQVGPVSKELTSVEVAEAFLAVPEVSVVYFGDDSNLKGEQ